MIRGRRFHHPLSSSLPKPLEDGEALLLVRAGNFQKLIEGHLRLAATIVSRYLSSSSNSDDMADELVGVAFYAVVDAVRLIQAGNLKHDNVTGYIATRINGDIRDSLANGRSVIRHPGADYQEVTPDVNINFFASSGEEVSPAVMPDTSLEVHELIASVVEDELDVRIVQMLLLGYRPRSIAMQIGIHESNVSRRINRIRQELRNVIE